MKKTWKLDGLDCANCAAKMESAIRKLGGVQNVSVSFMTQKLTIEAEESRMDDILRSAAAICRKIEPNCIIRARSRSHERGNLT